MTSRFCCIFLALALSTLGQAGAYRGGLVTPPLTKPEFILNDTSGVSFDFRGRTNGRVMLLFFGYTNLPGPVPDAYGKHRRGAEEVTAGYHRRGEARVRYNGSGA